MKVFITGASSGIGNALAHEYAKRSALIRPSENDRPASLMVIGLAARQVDMLQKLAQELQEKYPIQTCIYALDVRDSAALQTAAQDFITHFGAPNIVIANAGVSRGTLTEYAEDTAAFQAIMDINVMGMVHTFQPFIAAMKAAGQGQLVGVASVAGVRGWPGSGAYSASKAAVISYCESLRVEMQALNIAVSTIAPGYIRTPMTEINRYKMPFLMDVDVFAHKFANAVEDRVRFKIIPWQMGWAARLMRLIPPWLWDSMMKNMPHKKRLDWDWL
jgi:NAD(P)-dependent dehydrogenase (short-subunit alcohol dehydrogenase family)